MGTIKTVAYGFVPRDWAACDGQLLDIQKYSALFSVIGTIYGGDGRRTFALPDLRSRVPIHTDPTHRQGSTGGAAAVNLNVAEMPEHTHAVMATEDPASQTTPEGHTFGTGGRSALYAAPDASALVDMEPQSVANAGGGQAHDNMQPSLGLQYVICLNGSYPSRSGGFFGDSEDYIADVKAFPYGYAPRNWVPCEGQLLPIDGNQTLYSLLGTTYGGDGRTTFGLPDLRGRAPVGEGNLNGVVTTLGEKTGTETVTLTEAEIPSHDHQAQLVRSDPGDVSPAGNMTCASATNVGPFTDGTPDKAMDPSTLAEPSPNGQPHDNMMPFLTLNFCICVQGIFPSRS